MIPEHEIDLTYTDIVEKLRDQINDPCEVYVLAWGEVEDLPSGPDKEVFRISELAPIADALIRREIDTAGLVKVGISKSPQRRATQLNKEFRLGVRLARALGWENDSTGWVVAWTSGVMPRRWALRVERHTHRLLGDPGFRREYFHVPIFTAEALAGMYAGELWGDAVFVWRNNPHIPEPIRSEIAFDVWKQQRNLRGALYERGIEVVE